MFCENCATELPEGAKFCPACGTAAGGGEGTPGKQQFADTLARTRAADDSAEEELWQGQYSKLAMVGIWITLATLTVVVLIIGAVAQFPAMAWMIAAAGLVLIWAVSLLTLLLRQLSQHYYLTNQRFIHERGILWRKTDRIEAIDIDDVTFQQGPVERMFGVGTVTVHSSDQTHPELHLPGLERVHEVAGMIDEVRRKERHRRGLHIESV